MIGVHCRVTCFLEVGVSLRKQKKTSKNERPPDRFMGKRQKTVLPPMFHVTVIHQNTLDF